MYSYTCCSQKVIIIIIIIRDHGSVVHATGMALDSLDDCAAGPKFDMGVSAAASPAVSVASLPTPESANLVSRPENVEKRNICRSVASSANRE